jgi:hypothetical protein
MMKKSTCIAMALALLLSATGQAAPSAAMIKGRLGGSTTAFGTEMSAQNCNGNLVDSAGLSERLEWVEGVLSCLEELEGFYDSQRFDPNALTQRNAGIARSDAAATRQLAAQYRAQLQGEKDFLGAKWGVGVGYSHGFRNIVDEAEIVDGVVRVRKDLTGQPRVILEFHNYIWCHGNRAMDKQVETGCGPFAAVASRDDKAVSGVAAGAMYGWKTGTGADAKGWSVGLGVIVDSSGKKLGEGYIEGEPPPTGATSVFLVDKSAVSGILFFTRTF